MHKQIEQLWTLVKKSKFPKKLVLVVFALSIIETLASLAVPLFTMNMINDFSVTGFAWTAVTAVAIILVIQAILSGLTYFLMRMLGERIVANLRSTLWQHVLHLKTPYFDSHESGATMSRITQDTSVVKELVTDHLVSFVSGIFSIFGAIAILLWIDWSALF